VLRPLLATVRRRRQVLRRGVERTAARGDAGEQCVRPRDFAWSVHRRRHIQCPLGVRLGPWQIPGAITLLCRKAEEIRGEKAGVDAGQLVDG
jgi:hypothetical protein